MPAAELAPELASETVAEPDAEPVVEAVAEPVVEPVVEPASELIERIARVPSKAPAAESKPEPEPEPEPEPGPEPERAEAPRIDAPDTLEVLVGESVSFVVSASGGRDEATPGLTLVEAPGRAVLVDRGDGSRKFRWTPGPDDTGESTATFEARSAEAPDRIAARTLASVLLRMTPAPAPEPPLARGAFDDGPALRALAARHGVRIGSAAQQNVHHDLFGIPEAARYQEILTKEYDILTPENSLKMSEVQPERGRFDWVASDRIVEFAEANDMGVHGHPLLWHQQMPAWAEAFGKASAREGMRAIMNAHIDAVMSRYAGRIEVWDVVNEALEEDGQLRRTPWYRGVGPDYVHEAFVAAERADPQASLIHNDYGIGWTNPKSTALHGMSKAALERGTPIDGVGFQLHLITGFSTFDSIRRNFQRFADLGLDIWITELDIATDWQFGPVAEAERQAVVYAEVVKICLEQPRCKGLQVWGQSDRYAWRGTVDALPLDENFEPKPAFFAMRRARRDSPVAAGRR